MHPGLGSVGVIARAGCYNVRTKSRVVKGVFGIMGFVLRKYATTGEHVTEGRRFAPMAPGAVQSPQQPGQLPDVSLIPGKDVLPVAIPEEGPHRPATQYKTAEEILHVWENTGKDVLDPDRFVQAPPSYEEIRKAYPWKRKPARPTNGYALSTSGSRLSEQVAALAAAAESAEVTE